MTELEQEQLERDRASLVTLVLALERSWKTGKAEYATEAHIGLTVGARAAIKTAEDEEWKSGT